MAFAHNPRAVFNRYDSTSSMVENHIPCFKYNAAIMPEVLTYYDNLIARMASRSREVESYENVQSVLMETRETNSEIRKTNSEVRKTYSEFRKIRHDIEKLESKAEQVNREKEIKEKLDNIPVRPTDMKWAFPSNTHLFQQRIETECRNQAFQKRIDDAIEMAKDELAKMRSLNYRLEMEREMRTLYKDYEPIGPEKSIPRSGSTYRNTVSSHTFGEQSPVGFEKMQTGFRADTRKDPVEQPVIHYIEKKCSEKNGVENGFKHEDFRSSGKGTPEYYQQVDHHVENASTQTVDIEQIKKEPTIQQIKEPMYYNKNQTNKTAISEQYNELHTQKTGFNDREANLKGIIISEAVDQYETHKPDPIGLEMDKPENKVYETVKNEYAKVKEEMDGMKTELECLKKDMKNMYHGQENGTTIKTAMVQRLFEEEDPKVSKEISGIKNELDCLKRDMKSVYHEQENDNTLKTALVHPLFEDDDPYDADISCSLATDMPQRLKNYPASYDRENVYPPGKRINADKENHKWARDGKTKNPEVLDVIAYLIQQSQAHDKKKATVWNQEECGICLHKTNAEISHPREYTVTCSGQKCFSLKISNDSENVDIDVANVIAMKNADRHVHMSDSSGKTEPLLAEMGFEQGITEKLNINKCQEELSIRANSELSETAVGNEDKYSSQAEYISLSDEEFLAEYDSIKRNKIIEQNQKKKYESIKKQEKNKRRIKKASKEKPFTRSTLERQYGQEQSPIKKLRSTKEETKSLPQIEHLTNKMLSKHTVILNELEMNKCTKHETRDIKNEKEDSTEVSKIFTEENEYSTITEELENSTNTDKSKSLTAAEKYIESSFAEESKKFTVIEQSEKPMTDRKNTDIESYMNLKSSESEFCNFERTKQINGSKNTRKSKVKHDGAKLNLQMQRKPTKSLDPMSLKPENNHEELPKSEAIKTQEKEFYKRKEDSKAKPIRKEDSYSKVISLFNGKKNAMTTDSEISVISELAFESSSEKKELSETFDKLAVTNEPLISSILPFRDETKIEHDKIKEERRLIKQRQDDIFEEIETIKKQGKELAKKKKIQKTKTDTEQQNQQVAPVCAVQQNVVYKDYSEAELKLDPGVEGKQKLSQKTDVSSVQKIKNIINTNEQSFFTDRTSQINVAKDSNLNLLEKVNSISLTTESGSKIEVTDLNKNYRRKVSEKDTKRKIMKGLKKIGSKPIFKDIKGYFGISRLRNKKVKKKEDMFAEEDKFFNIDVDDEQSQESKQLEPDSVELISTVKEYISSSFTDGKSSECVSKYSVDTQNKQALNNETKMSTSEKVEEKLSLKEMEINGFQKKFGRKTNTKKVNAIAGECEMQKNKALEKDEKELKELQKMKMEVEENLFDQKEKEIQKELKPFAKETVTKIFNADLKENLNEKEKQNRESKKIEEVKEIAEPTLSKCHVQEHQKQSKGLDREDVKENEQNVQKENMKETLKDKEKENKKMIEMKEKAQKELLKCKEKENEKHVQKDNVKEKLQDKEKKDKNLRKMKETKEEKAQKNLLRSREKEKEKETKRLMKEKKKEGKRNEKEEKLRKQFEAKRLKLIEEQEKITLKQDEKRRQNTQNIFAKQEKEKKRQVELENKKETLLSKEKSKVKKEEEENITEKRKSDEKVNKESQDLKKTKIVKSGETIEAEEEKKLQEKIKKKKEDLIKQHEKNVKKQKEKEVIKNIKALQKKEKSLAKMEKMVKDLEKKNTKAEEKRLKKMEKENKKELKKMKKKLKEEKKKREKEMLQAVTIEPCKDNLGTNLIKNKIDSGSQLIEESEVTSMVCEEQTVTSSVEHSKANGNSTQTHSKTEKSTTEKTEKTESLSPEDKIGIVEPMINISVESDGDTSDDIRSANKKSKRETPDEAMQHSSYSESAKESTERRVYSAHDLKDNSKSLNKINTELFEDSKGNGKSLNKNDIESDWDSESSDVSHAVGQTEKTKTIKTERMVEIYEEMGRIESGQENLSEKEKRLENLEHELLELQGKNSINKSEVRDISDIDDSNEFAFESDWDNDESFDKEGKSNFEAQNIRKSSADRKKEQSSLRTKQILEEKRQIESGKEKLSTKEAKIRLEKLDKELREIKLDQELLEIDEILLDEKNYKDTKTSSKKASSDRKKDNTERMIEILTEMDRIESGKEKLSTKDKKTRLEKLDKELAQLQEEEENGKNTSNAQVLKVISEESKNGNTERMGEVLAEMDRLKSGKEKLSQKEKNKRLEKLDQELLQLKEIAENGRMTTQISKKKVGDQKKDNTERMIEVLAEIDRIESGKEKLSQKEKNQRLSDLDQELVHLQEIEESGQNNAEMFKKTPGDKKKDDIDSLNQLSKIKDDKGLQQQKVDICKRTAEILEEIHQIESGKVLLTPKEKRMRLETLNREFCRIQGVDEDEFAKQMEQESKKRNADRIIEILERIDRIESGKIFLLPKEKNVELEKLNKEIIDLQNNENKTVLKTDEKDDDVNAKINEIMGQIAYVESGKAGLSPEKRKEHVDKLIQELVETSEDPHEKNVDENLAKDKNTKCESEDENHSTEAENILDTLDKEKFIKCNKKKSKDSCDYYSSKDTSSQNISGVQDSKRNLFLEMMPQRNIPTKQQSDYNLQDQETSTESSVYSFYANKSERDLPCDPKEKNIVQGKSRNMFDNRSSIERMKEKIKALEEQKQTIKKSKKDAKKNKFSKHIAGPIEDREIQLQQRVDMLEMESGKNSRNDLDTKNNGIMAKVEKMVSLKHKMKFVGPLFAKALKRRKSEDDDSLELANESASLNALVDVDEIEARRNYRTFLYPDLDTSDEEFAKLDMKNNPKPEPEVQKQKKGFLKKMKAAAIKKKQALEKHTGLLYLTKEEEEQNKLERENAKKTSDQKSNTDYVDQSRSAPTAFVKEKSEQDKLENKNKTDKDRSVQRASKNQKQEKGFFKKVKSRLLNPKKKEVAPSKSQEKVEEEKPEVVQVEFLSYAFQKENNIKDEDLIYHGARQCW